MKTITSVLLATALAALLPTALAQPVLLNEVLINPPGNTVPNEYLEIAGPPSASLDGYVLLAINGNPGFAGRAELVLNLNGTQLGSNGILVVKVARTNGYPVPAETTVIADPRFIDTAISPLNNSSLSLLLVQCATLPTEGTDYDADDNGVFDVAPLNTATVLDAIGIRKLATDLVYGGARMPLVGDSKTCEAIVRFVGDLRPANVEAWYGGRLNGNGLATNFSAEVTANFPAGATLTPGAPNLVFTPLTVVQTGGRTDVDEDGTLDSYTIALYAPPATGQVTVALSADAQLQFSLNGVQFMAAGSITFTTSNVPVTVTVRAVDDGVAEGGYTHAGVIQHRIVATDDPVTLPTNSPVVSVSVNIFDNDSPLPAVLPTRETMSAFEPDDSDDIAFRIHPNDLSKSLLITTKKLGGGTVFDLNLNVIQALAPSTNGALRFNNVDVLYGFTLNGEGVDLAVFSDRVSDTLYIYRVADNAVTNPLTLVSADLTTHIFPGSAPDGDTAYGLCAYRSLVDHKHYIFVSRNGRSTIAQLELFDAGAGQVGWRRVRTISLPDPRQVEGMVADRELGWVYLAQEKVGLWKFPAEPTASSSGGTLLQSVRPAGTHLTYDIEGLCLYYDANGQGYLLVSSQGDNTFALFDRQGTNAWLGSFVIAANKWLRIDQVTTCDGADICCLALPGWEHGLLIVHDGENDGWVSPANTNFKLVPWENVASAFSPALAITPNASSDPRTPQPVAWRFSPVTWTTDGRVVLEVAGIWGATGQLQQSTNLVDWQSIGAVNFTAATMRLTNAPPPGERAFYRLQVP